MADRARALEIVNELLKELEEQGEYADQTWLNKIYELENYLLGEN